MVRKTLPQQSHIIFHKRAKDAAPDRLRQVLGSIVLKGPRPSSAFFDDEDDEPAPGANDRARH